MVKHTNFGPESSYTGLSPSLIPNGLDAAGMPAMGLKTASPGKSSADRPKAPLDTSAQVPTNTSQAFPKKSLEKRARSKFVTNVTAFPLASLRSPLQKSYKMTLKCSGQLTEARGKLTGLYCNQRWCLVCARIRTAKLMVGYLPAIEQLGDKWFVTLTVKNCKAKELPELIKEMHKVYTNRMRVVRERRKIKFSALRKFECTYNSKFNDYHPHFHLVIDSLHAAELLVEGWLEYFDDRADKEWQQIKECTEGAEMELFKYFTKIISKKDGNYEIHIKALDVMFRAMKGKRTFQACGIIKQINEDVDPDEAELTHRDVTACWSWLGSDWVDKETGEVLTGWEPTDNIIKISESVIMPAYALPKLAELRQLSENSQKVTKMYCYSYNCTNLVQKCPIYYYIEPCSMDNTYEKRPSSSLCSSSGSFDGLRVPPRTR